MTGAPFFYSDSMMQYNMGDQHPLKPIRLSMTLDLLRSYGLTQSALTVTEPALAKIDEVARVHDINFLKALQEIEGSGNRRDSYRFGLGTGDNPIFPGMWEASLRYSGGSIDAAQAIVDGASVAFNISGGLHHAHFDRAAGFCVLNDSALAVRRLQTRYKKVAYVDIDVHHGDGVQELFFEDPSVLTVSIHEVGRGFFPGTGYVEETGYSAGKGYCVNVPVAPYTNDVIWLKCWREAALPLLEEFSPDTIVLQMGTDPHYLDPLAHVCLTAQGWLEAVLDVKSLGKPIVAIGGGGYNLSTVPRMWTLAISKLLNLDLPNEVPESFAYHPIIPFLRDDEVPFVSTAGEEAALKFAEQTIQEIKSTRYFNR